MILKEIVMLKYCFNVVVGGSWIIYWRERIIFLILIGKKGFILLKYYCKSMRLFIFEIILILVFN